MAREQVARSVRAQARTAKLAHPYEAVGKTHSPAGTCSAGAGRHSVLVRVPDARQFSAHAAHSGAVAYLPAAAAARTGTTDSLPPPVDRQPAECLFLPVFGAV